MFEAKFKCSNSFLNISLSKTENGPWSALNMKCVSDLYQAPVGVVFRTFPDTNYVKLECVEEPEEEIQDQATGVNPPNAFQILMSSSAGATTKPRVPSKKRSRYVHKTNSY